MTATPNGTVVLIDAVDLVQVSPSGAIRTIARNLSKPRFLRPDIGPHHLLMGLWTDARGQRRRDLGAALVGGRRHVRARWEDGAAGVVGVERGPGAEAVIAGKN
jgi:hypothetical protein